MNSKSTLATLALAVALGILLAISISKQRQLKSELAAAGAEISLLNSTEKSAAQVPDNELDRLRADQREAIHLRGEVVRLKDVVQVAEKAAATAAKNISPRKLSEFEQTLLRLDPLPEDNPEVQVFKTQIVSTELPSGNGLVLGGWEMSPGKRTFVMIQPSRNEYGQISIKSKWVQLSEEFARRMGNPLANPGEQNFGVDRVAFDGMIKQFENAEGVDLLSPPTLTVSDGRQARASVVETHTTAAGPVEVGPRLDILPTLSEDGSQIRFSVQASMVQKPNL